MEPDAADDSRLRAPGSTWVATALITRARALRSLEARVVCRDLDAVSADKQNDLQYVWWRMLDVVRQKLSIQRDAGGGAPRLSAAEEALADLVLLLDDTICTLGESADYDSLQEQVALFHLAQQQGLETKGPGAAARWRRALLVHRVRHHNVSGLYLSIILLQRRWHELKLAARQAFAAYTRPRAGLEEAKPPSPLHVAIVKRFPHVVTSPAHSWRDLVHAGLVVEDEGDKSGTEAAGPLAPAPDSAPVPSAGPSCESYQTFALRHLRLGDDMLRQEDADDLIVIEKEIETIDLINGTEEQRQLNEPIHTSASDDELSGQLRSNRQNMAAELESELEMQLRELSAPSERGDAGESEMTLFQEAAQGPVMFIYDSDEELQCTEDRFQNIERIASQLAAEDGVHQTVSVKQEVHQTMPTYSCAVTDHSGGGRDEGGHDEGGRGGVASHAENSDDDCVSIDEKLLMVTQIALERVDSTAEWQQHAKRRSTIHINNYTC